MASRIGPLPGRKGTARDDVQDWLMFRGWHV
jgi:hypothetical protein